MSITGRSQGNDEQNNLGYLIGTDHETCQTTGQTSLDQANVSTGQHPVLRNDLQSATPRIWGKGRVNAVELALHLAVTPSISLLRMAGCGKSS